MKSIEDKGCYSHGPSPDISNGNSINFEFHKGSVPNRTPHHRTPLGKPTPSKWDDAQKWLVGLSRGGDKNQAKPRNSNADDRRLIAPVPQKEEEWEDEIQGPENGFPSPALNQYEVETKKVDCEDQSIWRINKPMQNSMASGVRSISVRDMGTEMTPITSQEPSRTGTPIKIRTPAARSPMSSGSSTPARYQHGLQEPEDYQAGSALEVGPAARGNGGTRQYVDDANFSSVAENVGSNQSTKPSPLETRAMAWDEAERAKYMARYKREEVKIQAWENHQKRKAEMEMRKMEVKAERMKARAQERLANKLATAKRIAEEKRANAETKLNEQAARTTERADYIRRTGHLPSSFSFKLPSLCW